MEEVKFITLIHHHQNALHQLTKVKLNEV